MTPGRPWRRNAWSRSCEWQKLMRHRRLPVEHPPPPLGGVRKQWPGKCACGVQSCMQSGEALRAGQIAWENEVCTEGGAVFRAGNQSPLAVRYAGCSSGAGVDVMCFSHRFHRCIGTFFGSHRAQLRPSYTCRHCHRRCSSRWSRSSPPGHVCPNGKGLGFDSGLLGGLLYGRVKMGLKLGCLVQK